MSSLAIRVENLSKRFFIGAAQERPTTFYDAVTSTVSAPWRRFRMLSHKSEELEEFWALRDLEFDVRDGDVVGIIGRNGAGKSTLLKILSRIVEPTTGRIEIHGRVASLLEVGTGFHPELTGRENIYLNGSILGMSNREIDSRFDEIVDFSGVEKFLETPFKRYSSGMGVRLAFAVAAHLDPEILIIDEVLAVGDAEFQKKCLGKMSEVAGAGRTVLFVSHNMPAVRNLTQRCIYLKDGEIAHSGPTSETIDLYLDATRSLTTEFNAPPDDEVKDVRIERVKLVSQAGTASFDISEPICIEIECRAQRPPKELHMSIQIRTNSGDPIVTSTTADFNLDSQINEAGRYFFHVAIPRFFLNTGSYELHAAPFVLGGRLLDLVQGLYFEVEDRRSSWPSKPFNRNRQGVVVNQLEWNCKLENKD